MARNLEEEQKRINNGTRYMVSPNGGSGVYPRDVDQLMSDYSNKRYKLYNKYKSNFENDPSGREELMSYINEQFTRLVREYFIIGGVDFPGYIDQKLENRVLNSFIRKSSKDRKRESPTKGEFDISNWADQNPSNDNELEYLEVLEYVFQGVQMSDLEREVLRHLLQEKTDVQIEQDIRATYPVTNKTPSIRRTIRETRRLLYRKLKESEQENLKK